MSLLQKIMNWLNGVRETSIVPVPESAQEKNLEAFYTTISVSEGTELIGDHGYNCLFGSTPENPKLFTSYADHPNISTFIPKLGVFTTAAGRYQILAHNYASYKKLLSLPDFSPSSQDAIAKQMIAECGALQAVYAGRLTEAVTKCASRWASFPTSTYGQPTQKIETLQVAFKQAGGISV